MWQGVSSLDEDIELHTLTMNTGFSGNNIPRQIHVITFKLPKIKDAFTALIQNK